MSSSSANFVDRVADPRPRSPQPLAYSSLGDEAHLASLRATVLLYCSRNNVYMIS